MNWIMNRLHRELQDDESTFERVEGCWLRVEQNENAPCHRRAAGPRPPPVAPPKRAAARFGWRIPTGFLPKAQGCEARATLGQHRPKVINPNGVVASVGAGGVPNEFASPREAFHLGASSSN